MAVQSATATSPAVDRSSITYPGGRLITQVADGIGRMIDVKEGAAVIANFSKRPVNPILFSRT